MLDEWEVHLYTINRFPLSLSVWYIQVVLEVGGRGISLDRYHYMALMLSYLQVIWCTRSRPRTCMAWPMKGEDRVLWGGSQDCCPPLFPHHLFGHQRYLEQATRSSWRTCKFFWYKGLSHTWAKSRDLVMVRVVPWVLRKSFYVVKGPQTLCEVRWTMLRDHCILCWRKKGGFGLI